MNLAVAITYRRPRESGGPGRPLEYLRPWVPLSRERRCFDKTLIRLGSFWVRLVGFRGRFYPIRRPLFQGSRRGTNGWVLSSMIVSSEPTAPSRLRSDQGRRGILCPVAGLLLKPARSSSAANVHAIRIETLPVADRVMTVRRPCNPVLAATFALGAESPRAGAGVQPPH